MSYAEVSPPLIEENPGLFSIVVTDKVVIERPLDEVFAFIADAENDALWCPAVVSIKQVAGSGPGKGAKYEMRHTPGGMKFEAIVETLVYEPSGRIEWRMIDKGHVLNGVYYLERVDQGTQLTQVSHIAFKGFLRIPGLLLKRVIQKDVQKELCKQFANLKQLLEKEESNEK